MDYPLSAIFSVVWLAIPFFVYFDVRKRETEYFGFPWGVAPWLWGVITYFLGIIGVLMYVIACSSASRGAARQRQRAIEALEEQNRRQQESGVSDPNGDYWANLKLTTFD